MMQRVRVRSRQADPRTALDEQAVVAPQRSEIRFLFGLCVAVAAGLAIGVLTAPAQGWLPAGVNSLSNSAGPWSLAAFLVALITRRPDRGAIYATLALVTTEVGYVIGSHIRGVTNAPDTVLFWVTAGLIAGPCIGIASVWSRQTRLVHRSVGFGLISGILIGEGIHGLTAIANTTSRPYWIGEILVGLALLTAGIWKHRAGLSVSVAVVVALVIAAVVNAAARTL